MDSDLLDKVLKKDRDTREHFRGVYARDALPANPKNGFYIINFDKTGEPGSHWVSVEIGKKFNSYFDSYGKPPPFHHLLKFLSGKKFRRNTQQVQHEYSTTCGQWCLYFIWRRCNGWNMKNITTPFKTKNHLLNDHVMNNIIRKRFKLDKKVIDRPFLKKQICRKMAENLAEWQLRHCSLTKAKRKRK